MTKILRPRPNWPMSISGRKISMFAGNITVPLLIALAAGPQYITVLIQISW